MPRKYAMSLRRAGVNPKGKHVNMSHQSPFETGKVNNRYLNLFSIIVGDQSKESVAERIPELCAGLDGTTSTSGTHDYDLWFHSMCAIVPAAVAGADLTDSQRSAVEAYLSGRPMIDYAIEQDVCLSSVCTQARKGLNKLLPIFNILDAYYAVIRELIIANLDNISFIN